MKVKRLEEPITDKTIAEISPNEQGLLALARNRPFVVPGGRFNEMYGWDSYFEGLGLLADGRLELARSMADQFIYEIAHYGKILNANRTYYLNRSQPPFLTAMATAVAAQMPAGRCASELAKNCNGCCCSRVHPSVDGARSLDRHGPESLRRLRE